MEDDLVDKTVSIQRTNIRCELMICGKVKINTNRISREYFGVDFSAQNKKQIIYKRRSGNSSVCWQFLVKNISLEVDKILIEDLLYALFW